MPTMGEVAVQSLLNNGIYDVHEASRLLRINPDLLARWVRPRRRTTKGVRLRKAAVVQPTYGGDLLSFYDLVSLMIVKELYARGVSTDDIRAGKELLAKELGTPYPFAHRHGPMQLATQGPHFLATLGPTWVEAGLGGQGVFYDVIAPVLKPLEYDNNELAKLWRPHDRVWVNPRVQAGSPCVEGRRVPTQFLLELVENGDSPEEVASAYDLQPEDVTAAIEWERSLAA